MERAALVLKVSYLLWPIVYWNFQHFILELETCLIIGGTAPAASGGAAEGTRASGGPRASGGLQAACHAARPDYCVAVFTVRMRRRPPNEMLELNNFDGKLQLLRIKRGSYLPVSERAGQLTRHKQSRRLTSITQPNNKIFIHIK